MTLRLPGLFVVPLALLLAVGPAAAQSDGNVMREPRAAPAKAAPAQPRNVTGKNAVVKQGGSEKDKSSPAPGDPAKKPPASPNKAAAMAPIVFYVAKGDANACGPGCGEWIAAEGRIDPGAAARFRALVDKVRARKLPVYFNSPGGTVGDAIEIGRIMRQRTMTAGVGLTIPDGCDPAQTQVPACSKLKRAGREVPAALDTSLAQCNSACVYTVLGATERRIPAGARLGVHSSKMTFQVRVDRPLTPAEQVRARGMFDQMAREKIRAAYDRLGRYIVEMGIDRGLFDAALSIPHEKVRFLTRDEIADFGIDRRPLVEDDWMVDERPGAKPTALKLIYQAGQKDIGTAYRLTFLRLACAAGADHVEVAYGQEQRFGPLPLPRPITVSAGEDKFVFGTTSIYRARSTIEKPQVEFRHARVPVSFFETAASSGTTELKEGSDQEVAGVALRVVKLSTVGLAKALRVLAKRCAAVPAQPAGPAEPAVPAQPAGQSASVPGQLH